MNIAIVGTRGILERYSGVEVAAAELACRLARKGHRVTVYCRMPPRGKEARPEGLPDGVTLVCIPTVPSKHWGTVIHVFLSTLHLLTTRVRIVHYHCLGPAVFSFIPRLFGKRVIVTVHGLDWKRAKWNRLARGVLRLCEYAAVYFPHRTIAVSGTLQEYYRIKYRRRIDYLPNGVNLPEPDKGPAGGSAGKTASFLYVGRIIPEKGLHYLMQAYAGLSRDVGLVIAGLPSFTDGYARRLAASAPRGVTFAGFVEKEALAALYRKAMVFVLPSEVEGMPVALLEAMSYGLCPLVSSIPECREVVGDCGLVFASGDPSDLREKLSYALAHPEQVASLGKKARERIRQQYLWDQIIGDYERTYQELCGAKP